MPLANQHWRRAGACAADSSGGGHVGQTLSGDACWMRARYTARSFLRSLSISIWILASSILLAAEESQARSGCLGSCADPRDPLHSCILQAPPSLTEQSLRELLSLLIHDAFRQDAEEIDIPSVGGEIH